jgi:hypothetical protein
MANSAIIEYRSNDVKKFFTKKGEKVVSFDNVLRKATSGDFDSCKAALGVSIVLWSQIKETVGLQLLEVDEIEEYVTDVKSPMYGFRNAQNAQEWLSLYFFMQLSAFANCGSLGDDGADLKGRCKAALQAMNTAKGITVAEVLEIAYRNKATPEAMFLTYLGFHCFESERARSAKGSTLFFINTFSEAVKLNRTKARSDKRLMATVLLVESIRVKESLVKYGSSSKDVESFVLPGGMDE